MENLADYFQRRPIHLAILIANLSAIIILLIRRDNSKPLRIFLFYLLISFATNLLTDILSSVRVNNIIYNNAWVLLSTIFTMFFFREVFLDTHIKKYILFGVYAYTLIFLADFFGSNPELPNLHEHKFVLYSLPLRSFVILVLCLIFYFELMKELYIEKLTSSAIFWIVSALFLYHAGSMFITAIFQSQYRWHSTEFYRTISRIPLYFEFISLGVVSIGLLRSKKYLIG